MYWYESKLSKIIMSSKNSSRFGTMTEFHDKPFFDNWVKKAPPKIREYLEKENQFLRKHIRKDSRVLDIGCGYGRTIQSIMSIPSKIVGIDDNPRMIKKALHALGKKTKVELFLENAEKMHFKNGYFDYVLCMANTFGNFDEKKVAILQEMKRVTKQNGTIYMSVFSERSIEYRVRGYKKAGMKILNIDQAETVLANDNLKLEQFDKNKLKQIFVKAKVRFKISPLATISYICTIKKFHHT